MLYLLLKWLHVLSAIVAVGSNLTYGIWITRASASPNNLPFTLRGVKLIDDRLANPAYGLLLITGLAMAGVGGLRLSTPWLLSALVLYVAVVLVGLFGFTPALRRQIELVDSDGLTSPAYQAAARRSTLLGVLTSVLVIVIVFLMVVKPGLWA